MHVFDIVAKRSYYYSGQQITHILDIVLLPSDDQYKIEKRIRSSVFLQQEDHYYHKREGLLIGKGPAIGQCEIISESTSTILNFAPTVLSALNLPVEQNLNGENIDEIFRSDHLEG